MDTAELRTLLIARRAQWMRRLEENRKAFDDAVAAINVDQAHLAEIEFAIDQLDDLQKAPTAPAPQLDSPLDICLAAIRKHFDTSMPIPGDDRSVASYLKSMGYKFRLPTVRSALAKIGKESRAGAESSSPPKEVQGNPPVVDTSAREPDSDEMPGFLRRPSTSQAAAE